MWTTFSHEATPLQWGAVISASLVAAVVDCRRQRIPNLLTFPLLLAGFAFSLARFGAAGLADSIAGCLLLGLPYALLFVFAGGGAGDAKMMGAIGAWLGIFSSGWVLLSVAVCGALLGVAFALVKGRGCSVAKNIGKMGYSLWFIIAGRRRWREVPELMVQGTNMLPMPYGLAIFCGVCAAATGALLWQF